MKHWSNFLKKKTHEINRLSRIARAFQNDIAYKQAELQSQKNGLHQLELQIVEVAKPLYENEIEVIKDIQLARETSAVYNKTPTDKLKNPNQKK
jgi:hypothetical protein